MFNFDTSDSPIVGCCTAVAFGTTPFPEIFVTIAGVTTRFDDLAHVLDTGGFDLAIIGNESLQWRPIGTTGIGNPGGAPGRVAEPGTFLLFGGGFVVLAQFKRRRIL